MISESYLYNSNSVQVVPVTSAQHAASFLNRMMIQEAKPPAYLKSIGNPDKKKAVDQLQAKPLLVKSVQAFPGIGEVKAVALLNAFGSIQCMMNASVQDLENKRSALSSSDCRRLHAFFNDEMMNKFQ